MKKTMRQRCKPHEAKCFFQEALKANTPDCILWPYAQMTKGYGAIGMGGKKISTSRLMCLQAHGEPLVEGVGAAHSCGNKLCINPRHLRWATQKENEADKILHQRTIQGKPGGRKLSKEIVHWLRNSPIRPYLTTRELTAIFEVTPNTISMAINGDTWQDAG